MHTNQILIFFHAYKDDMVEPSCELFYRWKQEGNPFK
jgi:hypothetical protein